MISNYKTKIIIEELQGVTTDDVGGLTGGTWTEIKRVWAKVEIKMGNQREYENDQFKDKISYKITTSYLQNMVSNFGTEEPFNSNFRIQLIDGNLISLHSVRPKDMRQKEIIITGIATGVLV